MLTLYFQMKCFSDFSRSRWTTKWTKFKVRAILYWWVIEDSAQCKCTINKKFLITAQASTFINALIHVCPTHLNNFVLFNCLNDWNEQLIQHYLRLVTTICFVSKQHTPRIMIHHRLQHYNTHSKRFNQSCRVHIMPHTPLAFITLRQGWTHT